MTILCLNISDIPIITIKDIDHRCIIQNISKPKAINLLENSVLEDRGYIQKNIVLLFSPFSTVFFTFLFSIYKMVGIMDVYKSLNISTITVMKNPEMLKFVPNHLKTKNMCKHAVKKLLYLL